MSIYGYEKNTTPFLSHLKESGKLYLFDAIAPANQTQYSIPMLYTRAAIHDFRRTFVQSSSILRDFRLYGYQTYWISNQGKIGSTDTTISSIAQEANVAHYSKKCMHTYKTKSDIEILHYLDKIKDNARKEMYVFHLMGSHADYRRRYTRDIRLIPRPKSVREKYDNTIYFTDYIIKHIVEKFSNKKVLIIYISDHGEVVGKKIHGHAFLPPYKDEYDIPFVVYSSIDNPRIGELYEDNKKGYFNLENFNYIVEYLSGIGNDKNISYSNNIFAVEPENIFDYNKLELYKE
jgi:heptose-I-phosphate ethanolaminephosphotransferase